MTPEQRKEAKRAIRAWARNQPGIRCTEKYVLEQLAFYADPGAGNTCFPSAETVGERCNLSARQVGTVFGALARWGLITRGARHGRGVVWTLNLGVVIGKDQRPAQAPVGQRGRKALPVRAEGASGVSDRKSVHGRSEGPSDQIGMEHAAIGREFRLRELREGKEVGKGGSPPLTRRPEVLPELPNGERRKAPRSRTALRFRVRDDTYDAGGKRTLGVGHYALTEGQAWQYAQDFSALNHDPSTGIEWVLKKAQRWCQDMERENAEVLRPRADLAAWLPRRWLAEENQKSVQRSRARRQPQLLTGTEA